MDFRLPDGNPFRLLAPFADMLNHSPEVEQCHVHDASSKALSVIAGKEYEAGDQVFINYGPIPNNRLLRLYGFIIPGNPNDSYDLVLATHPEAPFFQQKHKLWVSAGLDSTSTVALTFTDPLPKSVLRYLRIQRADESELAAIALHQVDATVRISDSNEIEVLKFLVESFCYLLDSFGTQVEKLEEQLAEGVYPPGGNAWAAAHVSLGEQRVLRLARKTVQDLLKAVEESESKTAKGSLSVPAICANCGKDSVKLMLCARCKAVMYCGRTCQVAHFSKHKAICRTIASGNA